MHFSNGATVGSGGEIHHPRSWFPDERDGIISWLRAEFAAANAIIDSLCHHLRGVSDPGEYDFVIGCVQQRRVAWNPVLHMQQFYPITEVMLALQQVACRRQQKVADQGRLGGKEFKRYGVHSYGSRYGNVAEATEEIHNLSASGLNLGANAFVMGSKEKKGTVKEREGSKLGRDKGLSDAQKQTALNKELLQPEFAPNPLKSQETDASLKSQVDNSPKTSTNRDGAVYPGIDSLSEGTKDVKTSNLKESNNLNVGKNSETTQSQKEEKLIVSPRTFHKMETIDGNTVNVAEGLNLYEKLLDDEEVPKLISLVNDLRATGKRGQLFGPTFLLSKRPSRGHGREMIQLGVAISEAPSDDDPTKDSSSKVEPIPDLLQSLIDRLLDMQVTTTKPDTCVIDIFNEGDYSQPQSFPLWYGRPICLLSLNDCDMVFGAALSGDHPGVYRGALSLTLSPGSLIVMQGNSTDIARRAIQSIRKQRILITFLKAEPSKAFQGEGPRLHLQAQQAPNWVPPSNRPPNHIRPKHYTPVPSTGVLPAPPIRARFQPPNGSPSLFVPPPVHPPPLPIGSTGWPAATPRHPPPRLPISGTGVFLPPPGSGGSLPPVPVKTGVAEISSVPKTTPQAETETDVGEENGNIIDSPKDKLGVKTQQEECKGS